MTLIIGMKYKEGIVLIGDRKVLDDNTGRSHWENKIDAPIAGVRVAVGAAGFTDLSREFNRKIGNMVDDRVNAFRLGNIVALNGTDIDIKEVEEGKRTDILLPHLYRAENFLDDCSLLTEQIAQAGKKYTPNPIEVLVAVNTDKNTLYEINSDGFKKEGDFFAIGSGATYIDKFLQDSYKKDMELGEAIHLAVFLIKFVEVLGLDNAVGIEPNKLPQIFVVNSKGAKEYEVKPIESAQEIINDVANRIDKIKKQIIWEPK